MQLSELDGQARALKETAETMIKAGYIGAVEVTTQQAAEALVQAARQLRPQNPVVKALSIRPGITWPEILTIASSILAS
jgi:hypothetical protein